LPFDAAPKSLDGGLAGRSIEHNTERVQIRNSARDPDLTPVAVERGGDLLGLESAIGKVEAICASRGNEQRTDREGE
jgi:hypothetical protein